MSSLGITDDPDALLAFSRSLQGPGLRKSQAFDPDQHLAREAAYWLAESMRAAELSGRAVGKCWGQDESNVRHILSARNASLDMVRLRKLPRAAQLRFVHLWLAELAANATGTDG